MKKIGLEEHFGTPELMQLRYDWFKRDGLPLTLPQAEVDRIGREIGPASIGERLALMDKCGMELQILMPGSNGIEGLPDKAEALAAAKAHNEALHEVVSAHPDRFAGFACVPLQAPELAAEELERCVTNYGFKGLGWLSGYVSKCGFIDEEQFHPIFERAEKLGVPLYLHPTETPLASSNAYQGHPALVGPAWSWSVDTATYTLRIIMSGLLDKYPGTKLIVGHLGEMLPFIMWRLENRLGFMPSAKKLSRSIREYFRENIFITTSGSFTDISLRCAIDAFGIDRVMFSVDYPFEPLVPACEWIDSSSISDEEKRLVCYENAEKLFGL